MLNPERHDENPNYLFNAVLQHLNLPTDAALCRKLDIKPPVISKIRHGKLSVGPMMLLRLHDATGLSIAQLRAWLYRQPTDAE